VAYVVGMTITDADSIQSIRESLSLDLDNMVALRREIHREPELGIANPLTRDRIVAALADLPLDVTIGSGEITSVVADLKCGEGPTVLLRADTDALPMTEESGLDFASTIPGRAHACGHDAHTAMLVGAARALSSMRSEIHGTVRFMFQPGEEGGGGAKLMVADGVLDCVDSAYALHISPNIPSGYLASRPGPFMASADEFEVTIRGKGGHASTPHFAIDPVTAAAHVITSIQTMVTREIHAFDPAVITIAKVVAGTTSNVIPETAVLSGTVRTISEATRAHVHKILPRVITGVAEAHGAAAEFRLRLGYPVTVNHASAVDLVADVTRRTLGERKYLELPTPVMGAEDFSYVLEQVPGAMSFLGVCPAGIADSLSAPACHSNKMILNESAMADGAAIHVMTALTALG